MPFFVFFYLSLLVMFVSLIYLIILFFLNKVDFRRLLIGITAGSCPYLLTFYFCLFHASYPADKTEWNTYIYADAIMAYFLSASLYCFIFPMVVHLSTKELSTSYIATVIYLFAIISICPVVCYLTLAL